ncbi:lipocalin family protein [Gelidibacter sp.]|uniref:lipocalin family protein n=1 Tax=Gelidibacter sp. TaxID=2018083 RepID=UPI002D0B51C3|nr:lipocalin family protein [Gelidibacter sp.]HUH28753.1 lipocalin family protein [Gelidibacter sp.]
MKNLAAKTKITQITFLMVGLLLLGACKNDTKTTMDNEVNSKDQKSIVENELLVGSWIDASDSALHFTLFNDGTARSDNMKTLLYKNWKVKGNQITFIVESIGNGTSSVDTLTYNIEKLTKNKLILKKDNYLSEYTKE